MAQDNYCFIHRTEHNISASYRIVDSLTHKVVACYMSRKSAQRATVKLNENEKQTTYIVVEMEPARCDA